MEMLNMKKGPIWNRIWPIYGKYSRLFIKEGPSCSSNDFLGELTYINSVKSPIETTLYGGVEHG